MSVSYEIRPTTIEREPGSEDRWTLNFGPQHPCTHTTLRLFIELEGERVVSCVPDIGFLHSGFEKLGEHLNYNQYVTIVERMNYCCPVSNDIAWRAAVEKLYEEKIREHVHHNW